MIHDPVTADEDTQTLFRALRTARASAIQAGEFLRKKRGKVEIVGKKALRDTLLDADLIAEDIIKRKLREDFPDFAILSEEAGEDGEKKDSAYRWVVDPLDGSANFQHGNPTFAISISLLINDVTTVGVVYLPLQREMFTAIKGQGAHLNGQPIIVSPTSDLNDSIVHVGDFAKDGNRRRNREQLEDIARLANAVGRIRMIGTAATDLAYVACGRADALVIYNALPWDIQVGCLLIQEAGGGVALRESDEGRLTVVCGNENIYQQLLNVIDDFPKVENGNGHLFSNSEAEHSQDKLLKWSREQAPVFL